ncbi:MAG: peptidoglycan-binding domain-containing protein [Pseudomonadota bacterium]
MRTLWLAMLFATAVPLVALAQTAALIVGIEDYDRVADVRRGDEANALREMLPDAIGAGDASAEELFEALEDYETGLSNASRQLIVLSGRFVSSATETYFLPRDAAAEPLSGISRNAVGLSTVLAYLARTPGDAVLALATDETSGTLGPLLDIGLGTIDLPQGVTLITGEPRDVARALTDLLEQPGRRIVDMSERRITVSGFLSRDQVLRDEVTAAAPDAAPQDDRLQDLLAWREADRTDTEASYQGYLSAHPNGQFAAMARNRLAALSDTPEARAERTEQALDLNRDQRREIQRDLTLLEFNTRGIDGIFGRGTRAAIEAWQRENDFEPTSYLSTEQITRLDAQAERRATELEAEAEAKRQEQLALDRAYWQETGAIGDEAGFRVYLERFPDGEFSEVARERLAEFERQKRRETDARDRQLWDEAAMENTRQAYRDYLTIAPNGAFRDEAQTRIAALERDNSSEVSEARQAEQALNLSASTRRLVESRLDRFGLKPGRVDGDFDNDTRRAIRRYQEARGLPITGYLTEVVIVRMLADSVGIRLR